MSSDEADGDSLSSKQRDDNRFVDSYHIAIENLKRNKIWLKDSKCGRRIGLYKIIQDLGKGNFSQVKLGIHSLTRDRVAIKIIDRAKLNAKTERFIVREIASMEKLAHPNILRLFQVMQTTSKIFMVLEFAEGGDLYTRVADDGRFYDKKCREVFRQLVSAVSYMHQSGVVHRDLKAENVLFSIGKFIKVGDFGFSTQVEQRDLLNTYCGSPPYAAPELFKDDFYRGEPVDVWALGILLYFMATGVLPFQADTIKKLKELILKGSFVIPAFVTPSCARLVRNILVPEPSQRPEVDELLTDDWLRLSGFKRKNSLMSKPVANPTSSEKIEELVLAELADYDITEEKLKDELDYSDHSSHLLAVYRIVRHRKMFEDDFPTNSISRLKLTDGGSAVSVSRFCVLL